MAIVKDFQQLRDVVVGGVGREKKKEKSGSSVTLNNTSKLPDSHYFKSRKKCDTTVVWYAENGGNPSVKALICEFLFPNQIKREFDSKNRTLIGFKWQNKTKNIQSKTYTFIDSGQKPGVEEEVILGWMCGVDKWVEYVLKVEDLRVEERIPAVKCVRKVSDNQVVGGVDADFLVVERG